jgi:DNA adenine methylase
MLAPWIISHFPPHRIYVEPFGGAASVLLRKPRSYAEVYNDLDGEIVNAFRVVRDEPRRLARALAWTPFARTEFRESFETTDDAVEQARRTIARSHMGFGSNSLNRKINSGFRSDAKRLGTTPARDWSMFPPTVRDVALRFRGVTIENRPALDVVAQADSPETLFYVDPPYVHDTRALTSMHGHHGYAHEMTDAQHEELAQALRGVAGMVVLSGYHGDLYERLYGPWRRVERETRADGGGERLEVLWFNERAWSAAENARAPLFAGTTNDAPGARTPEIGEGG